MLIMFLVVTLATPVEGRGAEVVMAEVEGSEEAFVKAGVRCIKSVRGTRLGQEYNQ